MTTATGTIVVDPDPVPGPKTIAYLFPENFNILSKILKVITTLTLMRRIK
jgi:hypothetical protein